MLMSQGFQPGLFVIVNAAGATPRQAGGNRIQLAASDRTFSFLSFAYDQWLPPGSR